MPKIIERIFGSQILIIGVVGILLYFFGIFIPGGNFPFPDIKYFIFIGYIYLLIKMNKGIKGAATELDLLIVTIIFTWYTAISLLHNLGCGIGNWLEPIIPNYDCITSSKLVSIDIWRILHFMRGDGW